MTKLRRSSLLSLKKSFVSRLTPIQQRASSYLAARPLTAFFMLLIALIGVIVLSAVLRKPPQDEIAKTPEPKSTAVFAVGGSPELVVQAEIEKTGNIRIVSLTSGVVQKVGVKEGERVKRGTRIASLSTNYQGGNVFSLSRQLSQKNYQSTLDTYQLQVDSIEASRLLAEKSETQASQLRDIARKSFDDTNALITLNEEIVTSLDAQINEAIAMSQPEATITGLKSQKAQALSGLANLRSGLRSAEYLNADSGEPADLARISRDNTLRQLELQRRGLDLSRDIAQLNLKIAQVNESLMYPVSPCPGVVERVLVSVGQVVNPGTTLAILRADAGEVSAVALVSSEIAHQVSPIEASTFEINNQNYSVVPRSIAQEPTDGSLHAVTYSLPTELSAVLSAGTSVIVKIPLSRGNDAALAVPLDSIYQSQNGAYVLLAEEIDGTLRAVSHQVALGDIAGSSVILTDGLKNGDTVILDRQIIAGDLVKVQE